MTYGDTSYVLAIYLVSDPFHAQAVKIAGRLKEPIPLTLLGELELVNGVRRCLTAGIIDRREHDAIFRQISDDESSGILVRHSLQQLEHYARARELSKKFTPEISARSLDILHVAAALLLKETQFASFDEKQRILAQKAGLKLLPDTITRKKPN